MGKVAPKHIMALLAVTVVGLIFIGGKSAKAESANYEFTANEGDSLSVITRRAVQLVDDKDSSFKLNQPQAMFVETNYVQQQGSPLLEIGQKVTVNTTKLAELCKQATKLTTDEQANWKVYADRASYEVSYLKPNGSSAGSTTNSTNNATNTTTTPSPTPASSNSANPTPSTDSKNTSENKKSSQWYWWLIGLVVLGGLWYLLGGKSKSND